MEDYGNIDWNQIQQQKQAEEMKRQLLSRMLTKEAFERLGRVKTVNPQLASQAELYIMQVLQTGYNKRIGDEELKEMLRSLTKRGKDFRMKRV